MRTRQGLDPSIATQPPPYREQPDIHLFLSSPRRVLSPFSLLSIHSFIHSVVANNAPSQTVTCQQALPGASHLALRLRLSHSRSPADITSSSRKVSRRKPNRSVPTRQPQSEPEPQQASSIVSAPRTSNRIGQQHSLLTLSPSPKSNRRFLPIIDPSPGFNWHLSCTYSKPHQTGSLV